MKHLSDHVCIFTINQDKWYQWAIAVTFAFNFSTDHKLEFLIGDTVLPYNMTVYQAVRQYGDQTDTDTDTEAPLGM